MDPLQQQQYREQTLQTPRYADEKRLLRFGAKAYSQNDEDGILAEIFRRIGAGNKTFVEIGVGTGVENNTVTLVLSGWRGLWLEANQAEAAAARQNLASYVAANQLTIENQFVTRDNVESLISRFAAGLDLLSIDMDGNDYWVWEAVRSASPRVVVIEYNATWFPPLSLSVRYDEKFKWDGTNYHGASLKALELLGKRKGYNLVGCNFSGVNAFFVRQDLCAQHFREPYTAENHYEPPRYWMTQTTGHPPRIGPFEIIS